MQFKRHIVLVFSLMVILGACRKLDLAPSYQETDLDFWKRPDAAWNTLNTVYAQMYSDEYFFFNEDLSDNAFCISAVNGGRVRNIAEGAYDGRTDRVAGEWAFHYGGIRGCNNLLGNIDKVPGLSEAVKNRIIAVLSGPFIILTSIPGMVMCHLLPTRSTLKKVLPLAGQPKQP
jgi:hypothetical protein